MKEVMEPAYRFLPLHHVSQVRKLLELPSTVAPRPSPKPCCYDTHAVAPPEVVEEVFRVSPLLNPRVRALRDTIAASTLIPDSPLRIAMDLDAPAPTYAPMPTTPLGMTIIHCPPTPPMETHDSWCTCSPCLAAQDELYGT